MERRDVIFFALLMLALETGLAAESGPIPVQLTETQKGLLLQAPAQFMNQPPSQELQRAMSKGDVVSVQVTKSVHSAEPESAKTIGSDMLTTYQGWIRYAPVVRTPTRSLRPVVLCVSQPLDERNWIHCQSDSWLQFRTPHMDTAIRLNGEISDEMVEQLFGFIDTADLTSEIDGRPITSDQIRIVSKSLGEGIFVSVASSLPCETQLIRLRHSIDADGKAQFTVVSSD